MFRRRSLLPNRSYLIADPVQPVVELPPCTSALLAPRGTTTKGQAVGAASQAASVSVAALSVAVGGRVACTGKYVASRLVGRSVFALAPRGDTASSRRLSDAMLYGAVPIFISDNLLDVGAPFRCHVPYQLFSLQLTERAFMRDPGRALRAAENLSAAAIGRMQALIAHFRQDLLWRHPRSRVAENVLLEAARLLGRPEACCPFAAIHQTAPT